VADHLVRPTAIGTGLKKFSPTSQAIQLPPLPRVEKYASEQDGESSYVNCLLTTLGQQPPMAVELCHGEPLPDLTKLPTVPEEIECGLTAASSDSADDARSCLRLLRKLSGRRSCHSNTTF
jgi:hypothetical protein